MKAKSVSLKTPTAEHIQEHYGTYATHNCRSVGPSRSGDLPRHACENLAGSSYPDQFWPENQRSHRSETRRPAPARKRSLFSFSDSHGNAPILAGLPIPRDLGAI